VFATVIEVESLASVARPANIPRLMQHATPTPQQTRTFNQSRTILALVWGLAGILGAAGCVVHRPPLFPLATLAESVGSTGTERYYDLNADGTADFAELLGANGRVAKLRWLGADRTVTREVDWPPQGASASRRRILIIADSVPLELVAQAWSGGRFRLFAPPSGIIAPFPVMTDLSLNDLFGCSPSAGVEAEYFDGVKLIAGWDTYFKETNSPWVEHIDARLPFSAHGDVYSHPLESLDRELAIIADEIARKPGDSIGYVLATSALGLQIGRDGHVAGLIRLDRFCLALAERLNGEVDITLLSDHGHVLEFGRRVPFDWKLRQMGYRVGSSLKRPEDVVLPEFGDISCLALHSRSPQPLAGDVASIGGVELSFYREPTGDVIVQGPAGRARVTQHGTRYRYVCERGDPLLMQPTVDELRARGLVDADGFIDDAVLWDATTTHEYPDALRRICRAFEDEVSHVPDVYASLQEGVAFASPLLALFVNCRADHGSLRRRSTTGFIMSTTGTLPPHLRMENVQAVLRTQNAWPHMHETRK
jgi:hypothetical protein